MPMQPGQGPLHEGRAAPACYSSIRGCACDWCVRRRADRQAVSARQSEIKASPHRLVAADMFKEARDRVVYWHDQRGMSHEQIRILCGLPSATQVMLTIGTPSRRTASMRLATYRKIMSPPLDAEPPVTAFRRRAGVSVPIVGSRRRIQALNAIGFDCNTIATLVPNMEGRKLAAIGGGYSPHQYVTRQMHDDIRAAYGKLSNGNPADWGVAGRVLAFVLNRAARLGFAPPACWDDDTIDDPSAIPDWTGACGTSKGFSRHRASGIPACQACREAVNADRRKSDGYMARRGHRDAA